MGIKNLTSYFHQKLDIPLSDVPNGSTLVIDGYGWLFHLKQKSTLRSDLGGSYVPFISALKEDISFLRSFDFQLLVLFDGKKNPLKKQTSLERFREKEKMWESLHKICTGESDSVPERDLPMPPLLKEQMITNLADHGVEVRNCSFEADPEIALQVNAQNGSPSAPRSFIYGSDSDFLVMKDCPYIEFGKIVKSKDETAQAPVWRRSMCTKLFGTEETFVEFVLFVGNDYTAPLIEDTPVRVECDQESKHPFQMMDTWLASLKKKQSKTLRAEDMFSPLPLKSSPQVKADRESHIEKLQFAIEYSRAAYNLKPLDAFHQHPLWVAAPKIKYSSAHCVFDFKHYGKSEGQFFSDMNAHRDRTLKSGVVGVDRGVCVHALKFLRYKNTKGEESCVTEDHMRAISAMNKQLSLPVRKTVVASSHPHWEDAVAAFVYQKACSYVVRAFPAGAFPGADNSPARLFDGALFHANMQLLRDDEEAFEAEMKELSSLSTAPTAGATTTATVNPVVGSSVDRAHCPEVLQNVSVGQASEVEKAEAASLVPSAPLVATSPSGGGVSLPSSAASPVMRAQLSKKMKSKYEAVAAIDYRASHLARKAAARPEN